MPRAPLRYCAENGCPTLVSAGRCAQHQTQQRQEQQRYQRGGGLYGRKWAKARATYLAHHPYCVDCHAEGTSILAEELDHVIPHRGDRALFWDETNWASRCKPHHSAKTAREVGFGGA